MTAEEIYIKLKDELTAENESSSSPERIFIKNEGQTICTLGMNRSHEIIFVEFKPTPKDLPIIERESSFVHPHPVEMLHDAGWRQAQLTSWEEAEKLLEIIQRSYKRKKPKSVEVGPRGARRGKMRARVEVRAAREVVEKKPVTVAKAKPRPKPAPKKAKKATRSKAAVKAKHKAKPKPKAKPKKAVAKKKPAKKKKR